jgi:hypothetical protein
MKYLFFFNGQPLLLCCVCCKIAIQDFLIGLHKKNKKNLPFHRRVYWRTITRWYFTESCKTITGLCYNHRRICRQTITRRYFIESCKKITGLCHIHRQVYRRSYRRTIPAKSPTDLRTSWSAHMSDTCPSAQIPMELPMESPKTLRTSRSARMCDTCPSARIPTDFPMDRKVWRDFRTFFGTHFN